MEPPQDSGPSAFEELQSFVASADDEFDRMRTERQLIIDCLREHMSLMTSRITAEDSLTEVLADKGSSSSQSAQPQAQASQTQGPAMAISSSSKSAPGPSFPADPEVPFPDQTGDEVGDEAGDEDQHPEPEQPEVPEVTADQMQLLLQKDPKFADTALKMAMFPTTIHWNHPDVIHVEKTMIFELNIFKKMKDRGPPGPGKGGPETWRGQSWRKSSQRWGTRGGRQVRLANFVEQFGKAKGKQAFLQDEAERAAKTARKGKSKGE